MWMESDLFNTMSQAVKWSVQFQSTLDPRGEHKKL